MYLYTLESKLFPRKMHRNLFDDDAILHTVYTYASEEEPITCRWSKCPVHACLRAEARVAFLQAAVKFRLNKDGIEAQLIMASSWKLLSAVPTLTGHLES